MACIGIRYYWLIFVRNIDKQKNRQAMKNTDQNTFVLTDETRLIVKAYMEQQREKHNKLMLKRGKQPKK